jgi:hypothetical protein
MTNKALYEGCVDLWYGIEPIHYFNMGEFVTGERGCYHGPSEYRAPGYIEGTGLTLASPSIANWLFAVESVYDFSTMEHDYFVNGSFDISGLPGFGLSDFLWGGVGTQYSGYVYGLRTTQSINDQYPGAAFVGYLGISGGTGSGLREGIGVGIGTTGFVSIKDPTIRGYSQYISISLGFDPLPIVDAGLGIIQMKSATYNTPSTYIGDKGVKALNLYLDILLGRHSVWLSDFQLLPSMLTLDSRFHAANSALKYITAYEDLH